MLRLRLPASARVESPEDELHSRRSRAVSAAGDPVTVVFEEDERPGKPPSWAPELGLYLGGLPRAVVTASSSPPDRLPAASCLAPECHLSASYSPPRRLLVALAGCHPIVFCLPPLALCMLPPA